MMSGDIGILFAGSVLKVFSRTLPAIGARRFALLVAIVAAMAVYTVGVALAATIATNGSFEDPAGAGDPTGWIVSNVDRLSSSGGWEAVDGTWIIDLNGSDAGSISQVLTTSSGSDYTVTFQMAGNPQCSNPLTLDMTVSDNVDENDAFSFTTDSGATIGNLGWVEETFTFTATAITTLLVFSSDTAGACGATLDNVVVELVVAPPVPGVTFWGMALLGAALIALVVSRRLRTRPARV